MHWRDESGVHLFRISNPHPYWAVLYFKWVRCYFCCGRNALRWWQRRNVYTLPLLIILPAMIPTLYIFSIDTTQRKPDIPMATAIFQHWNFSWVGFKDDQFPATNLLMQRILLRKFLYQTGKVPLIFDIHARRTSYGVFCLRVVGFLLSVSLIILIWGLLRFWNSEIKKSVSSAQSNKICYAHHYFPSWHQSFKG